MSLSLFSLSIDDGHPLDMKLAALLDKHGLAATFYIPGRNQEGLPVMNAEQIRELASRFEMGSHTLEHRFLTELSPEQSYRQIVDGKRALEDLLGQSVQGFCYPGGKFHTLHCKQVKAAGFLYARTTQNLRLDIGTRAFELPTTLQFYPHTSKVLLRNYLSQGNWHKRWLPLSVVLSTPDWLARLYLLFNHVCAQDGMFHLWCHTIDIERLELWNALDNFLACVARRIPPAHRVSNSALLKHLAPVSVRAHGVEGWAARDA